LLSVCIDFGQRMSRWINTWSLWLLSSLCSTWERSMQSSWCTIEQTIRSMRWKSSMQVSWFYLFL